MALRAETEPKFAKFREYFKYIYTGRVLEILEDNDFDIIHNHLGWRLLPFSRRFHSKLLTTIHKSVYDPDQKVGYEPYTHYAYTSISKNQELGMPELNFVGTAYNGIEVDRFTVGDGKGEYLAFLGRMSPEKGPLEAIEIAKAAGKKLRMAAKVDITDQAYFDANIKPLIDGEQIQFIGEVNHEQKNEFLGNASALLMPIQWDEPFGLVTVEAFACGTPVIALKRGALPEVIKDGEVGFLCDTVDQMIERVGDLPKINRQACRDYVEERFTARRMAESYVNIYKEFTANPNGNATANPRMG